MSIYSGFATRAAETRYDQLTVRLIALLLTKLHQQQCFQDTAFRAAVQRYFYFMQSMQENKYLDPKIGSLFIPKLENLDFTLSEQPSRKSRRVDSSQQKSRQREYSSKQYSQPGESRQVIRQVEARSYLPSKTIRDKGKGKRVVDQHEEQELSRKTFDIKSKISRIKEGMAKHTQLNHTLHSNMALLTEESQETVFNTRLNTSGHNWHRKMHL